MIAEGVRICSILLDRTRDVLLVLQKVTLLLGDACLLRRRRAKKPEDHWFAGGTLEDGTLPSSERSLTIG